MKLPWLVVGSVLASAASAQTPDVAPFLELNPTWLVRSDKKSYFNWYDPTGRQSLVGLRMILESGLRAYVAQRLQRVENSGDPDTLDEYYIENRGHWRVGKQYLPFGRRETIRTTVPAARLDTTLLLDEAPVSVAVFDAGSGRPRGVSGRLGGPIGVSFMVGSHLAVQPTDLAHFRNLETAPGAGRGHRLLLGADTQIGLGSAQMSLEWVSLRRGETDLDRDQDVSDVRLRFRLPDRDDRVTLGWAKNWTDGQDTTLCEVHLAASERLSYRPAIRFNGLSFREFSFSVVVKL